MNWITPLRWWRHNRDRDTEPAVGQSWVGRGIEFRIDGISSSGRYVVVGFDIGGKRFKAYYRNMTLTFEAWRELVDSQRMYLRQQSAAIRALLRG